jgi:hypothetical protein
VFVLTGAQTANAFFSTNESSQSSAAASSLDIALSSSQTSSTTRAATTTNTGDLSTSYTITSQTENTAEGDVCLGITAEATQDGAEVYDGPVANLYASSSPLSVGESEATRYEFSAQDNLSQNGACRVTLTYAASQNGQNYGQAFYDSQTDTFQLTAADFGQEPDTDTDSEPADVVINEIYPDPTGDNTSAPDSEFVEIFNAGGVTADISGWQLHDNTGQRHTFASSTEIGPGGYVVVGFSAVLNNSGDEITLFNSSSTAVDNIIYSSGDVDEQRSISRCPDGGGVVYDRPATKQAANDCPKQQPSTASFSASQTQTLGGQDQLKARDETASFTAESSFTTTTKSKTTDTSTSTNKTRTSTPPEDTSATSTSTSTATTEQDENNDEEHRIPADEPNEAKQPDPAKDPDGQIDDAASTSSTTKEAPRESEDPAEQSSEETDRKEESEETEIKNTPEDETVEQADKEEKDSTEEASKKAKESEV